jgi:hypothetical protein
MRLGRGSVKTFPKTAGNGTKKSHLAGFLDETTLAWVSSLSLYLYSCTWGKQPELARIVSISMVTGNKLKKFHRGDPNRPPVRQ